MKIQLYLTPFGAILLLKMFVHLYIISLFMYMNIHIFVLLTSLRLLLGLSLFSFESQTESLVFIHVICIIESNILSIGCILCDPAKRCKRAKACTAKKCIKIGSNCNYKVGNDIP